MVAMASKEVLTYSKSFFSGLWLFHIVVIMKPGALSSYRSFVTLAKHKANEGHVWIYLQNPICNRLTVEYLYTEHVRNSEKISLGLTLEFMFSLICSILKSQSIMHRYLLPEDYSDCLFLGPHCIITPVPLDECPLPRTHQKAPWGKQPCHICLHTSTAWSVPAS